MSITKTMIVGRRKLPAGQKKITWSLSISEPLLKKLKAHATHGKTAQLANKILWEGIEQLERKGK